MKRRHVFLVELEFVSKFCCSLKLRKLKISLKNLILAKDSDISTFENDDKEPEEKSYSRVSVGRF